MDSLTPAERAERAAIHANAELRRKELSTMTRKQREAAEDAEAEQVRAIRTEPNHQGPPQ